MKRDEKKCMSWTCCGMGPGQEDTGSGQSGNCSWQGEKAGTPAGPVARADTRLNWRDITGAWKARWGMGRMNYRVAPGLYAVGTPGPDSPVLVTANYKLSFDSLRRELSGLDAWLMVVDTNGINVWCAAGKGTFGTTEVVRRIAQVNLREIVSHRTIILPQLAAPGVAAHEVQKQSGFRVVFGPVRAADVPAFLRSGYKATPEMRQAGFGFRERLALVPVELAHLAGPVLVLALALLGLNATAAWLKGTGVSLALLMAGTALNLVPFLGAILAGAVLVPALLPFIPGRAFAWKGWLLGMLWSLVYIFGFAAVTGAVQTVGYLLFLPAASAFLALNFTGSTAYTSLSGVLKEMNFALPAIIVASGAGLCGIITGFFL